MIRDANSWNAIEKEIRAGDRVIIVFSAPWCKPCETVYKIIEGVLEEVRGVKAYRVDVTRMQEIAVMHRVLSVPLTLVYGNGRLKARIAGVPGEDQILAALEKD